MKRINILTSIFLLILTGGIFNSCKENKKEIATEVLEERIEVETEEIEILEQKRFYSGIWNTNMTDDYSIITGMPFSDNKRIKLESTVLDNGDTEILCLTNKAGSQGYRTDEGVGMIIETKELYVKQRGIENIKGGYWSVLNDTRKAHHTINWTLQDNFLNQGMLIAYTGYESEFVLTLNERQYKCSEDYSIAVLVDGVLIMGENNKPYRLTHGNSIYLKGKRVVISQTSGSCQKGSIRGSLKIFNPTLKIRETESRFLSGSWATSNQYPSQIISTNQNNNISKLFSVSSQAVWDGDIDSFIYYYGNRAQNVPGAPQNFEGGAYLGFGYEFYVKQDVKEPSHYGLWEVINDRRVTRDVLQFSLQDKLGAESTIASLKEESEAVITFKKPVNGQGGCTGQVLFTVKVDGKYVEGLKNQMQLFLPGSSVHVKGKVFQVFLASGQCGHLKRHHGFIKFPN